MKKRKTKKQWIISEDGKSLLQNLAGESERVRVIIASTFLENGLECCLRWKLRNETRGEVDTFINRWFSNAFGDFARKVSKAKKI